MYTLLTFTPVHSLVGEGSNAVQGVSDFKHIQHSTFLLSFPRQGQQNFTNGKFEASLFQRKSIVLTKMFLSLKSCVLLCLIADKQMRCLSRSNSSLCIRKQQQIEPSFVKFLLVCNSQVRLLFSLFTNRFQKQASYQSLGLAPKK